MFKDKLAIFYIVCFLLFVIFIFFRCNNYYKILSGKNGRFTVAHVYKRDTGSKGSVYYDYIYKVDSNYYSTSTSGSNLKNLDSVCPQYFLVAYDDANPTIHTVLWSYRFDAVVPLGTKLDTLIFDRGIIKKHTVGWNGLSPKSDIDDPKAMDEYQQKVHVRF